jgi:transposase
MMRRRNSSPEIARKPMDAVSMLKMLILGGFYNLSGDQVEYQVREVSRRLGVSTHSLYKWLKLFAVPASKAVSVDHEAENRRLKRELARMTEERDILKLAGLEIDPGDQYPGVTPPRTSRRMQSEVRVCRRSSQPVFGPCDVPLLRHSSQRVLCMD